MAWRRSFVFMYPKTHKHTHKHTVLCNTPGFTTAPITEPDWSDAGRIRHSGEQDYTGTAEERISSPTRVTLISARVGLIYGRKKIQVNDLQKKKTLHVLRVVVVAHWYLL